MKNMLDNLIEVNGITDILPRYSANFKEFQIQEVVCIPSEKPDIEQILSVSVEAIIFKTSIIPTPIGHSCEGQTLDGKKLLVRGKLLQKIEYVANCQLQSVHIAEFEKFFSTFIVLEDNVDTNQHIIVTPYIEDIFIKQINKREVFKNIMLHVDAVIQEQDIANCEHEDMKYRKCLHKLAGRRYFTQFASEENIVIPRSKPDSEQIVSTIVDPEIISMKVVDTICGLSREGQHLSGKKIAVELKIKQKILYAADVESQSMHGVENEYYQSAYVVVPEFIEGTDPAVLLKHKLLQPTITVEDVYVRQIDKRKIFKNVTLFLEFCYKPTYEICYSNYSSCTDSSIYAIYENGNNCRKIIHIEDCKCIKPVWSPDGQSIAYISECSDEATLNLISLKNPLLNQLKYHKRFKTIGSINWSLDGKKILFSAVELNNKEIYSIDTKSFKIEKLTNGYGMGKCYKPKCAPSGGKMAYLRVSSNLPSLCVSDMEGLNVRQLTSNHCVMDYDWFNCGESIVFISSNGNKADRLITIDTNSNNEKVLVKCDEMKEKQCVRVSPDNRYIAFIGSGFSKECNNIFVYDVNCKSVVNLTRYCHNIKINELVWKVDSSKIYYTSNELGYYNIYSVSLMDFCKTQLTNVKALKMQLSYRPRVK